MSFIDSTRDKYNQDGSPRIEAPVSTQPRAYTGEATAYASTALIKECDAVAQAHEGTRNDQLNRSAFNLGQLIAGGELPHQLVWDELSAVALVNGLDGSEIHKTLSSGLNSGMQHPRQRPEADAAPLVTTLTTDAEHRDLFALAVEARVRDLQINDAAQRILRTQRAGTQQRPGVESLTAFLSVEDEPARYRVDQLWPIGGRGILAAQYKAGKSTTVGNVLRSLVDGTPFLGTYDVEQARDVVLVDNELDPRTLRVWLRDQDISNTDRVRIITLRGRTATFDLLDPQTRADWAQAITGADVVILDCLRPVLDALGLDENKDAGRFLVAFDALLADSGASEALIVHHMGHSGERSRGDSRLQDWPDVTWKIVREDPDNPASVSYFSAFGRDVNVAESQLEFDPITRHLRLIGGSRKDAKVGDKLDDVLTFLESSPGTSKTGIKTALQGDSKAIAAAVDKGVQQGLIEQRERQGRGGGFAYFLTRVNSGEPGSSGVPNPGNPGYTTGFRFGSSDPLIEEGAHPGSDKEQS